MERIVVARFSMIVLAAQLAGSCVLFAFLCRSFVPPIAFVPVGALLLGVGMYWHRGRAIWIENGRIFFRDASLLWAVSRDLHQIEDVVPGREDTMTWPIWFSAIVLKLRGGGEARIMTFALTPDRHVILARLRDALKMPQTA